MSGLASQRCLFLLVAALLTACAAESTPVAMTAASQKPLKTIANETGLRIGTAV
ncbi:hypothetical protein [Oceanicoccus sagamiensis]|uniref:hypothetical protein n=1 Tax=Oceanicoccus sagamiensis TaxID=716816 RepID=UPI0012F4B2C4|nr:hypothetical protein [Oceanicoccus sagamiensis]